MLTSALGDHEWRAMPKNYSMPLCGSRPSPRGFPQTALFGCDELLLDHKNEMPLLESLPQHTPLALCTLAHLPWRTYPVGGYFFVPPVEQAP